MNIKWKKYRRVDYIYDDMVRGTLFNFDKMKMSDGCSTYDIKIVKDKFFILTNHVDWNTGKPVGEIRTTPINDWLEVDYYNPAWDNVDDDDFDYQDATPSIYKDAEPFVKALFREWTKVKSKCKCETFKTFKSLYSKYQVCKTCGSIKGDKYAKYKQRKSTKHK
jgi:hypothetical protein